MGRCFRRQCAGWVGGWVGGCGVGCGVGVGVVVGGGGGGLRRCMRARHLAHRVCLHGRHLPVSKALRLGLLPQPAAPTHTRTTASHICCLPIHLFELLTQLPPPPVFCSPTTCCSRQTSRASSQMWGSRACRSAGECSPQAAHHISRGTCRPPSPQACWPLAPPTGLQAPDPAPTPRSPHPHPQSRTFMSDLPALVGTWAYVAPEILMGGVNCSNAVDIYRCAAWGAGLPGANSEGPFHGSLLLTLIWG